mmetsp:Transcript_701/g.873  ORF Transcript_701/g.873 Transcript_701/m.873 type:complete len:104 (-) Transcript_701:478-789(-)
MKSLNNLKEFDALLKNEDKLIVIDFTATWCPPCKMIGPIFEAMATQFPDAILVKVDVDAASDIAEKCGISAMPTFQYYKNGEKVGETCGADAEKIKALIVEHM